MDIKKICTQLVATALLAVFVAACGKGSVTGKLEKDPTKGYEVLNTAITPQPFATKPQSSMSQLFYIHVNDDLTFVQGEKRKVIFTTALAFVDLPNVKYHLTMKEGPAELGAKFIRESKNSWALVWQPSKNVLNSTENFKKFNLIIDFVLESTSSPAAKAEFAGQASESVYKITLQKDFSQPNIEDKLEITPGTTLTADETARIRFVVAAKSLDKPEDLVVNLYSGPREVASELAQFDGLEGVRGVRPVFKSFLGKDSSGRDRYEFEIIFKSKPFLNYALPEIKNQPNLKRRIESKEIKAIEAVFSIEGFNSYNHAVSAQKNINLIVSLPEVLIADSANKEVPK